MGVDELMPYTKEDEALIWQMFERTPQSAEEDVETIKKWMKTQPHIPETLNHNVPADAAIKSFLRMNKCSIEQCKQKIDSYYSIRNFIPELFSHHPLSPEMLESYKVFDFTSLPKRVGLDRVLVMKLRDHDPEKLNTEHLFNHIINVTEIRLLCDCSFRDIYIYDLSGTRMAHLLKTPLTRLQKLQAIGDQVYSSRASALHFINGFEAFLSIIKAALKPKLRDRVHIHKSYDSLYEFVPREILPKDLGGKEKSLKELAEIQLKCFEEMKERFDVLVNMKSNEELRTGKPVNDEFFGFYGNFKKIEFD